jgi:hypothetical protein
MAHLPNLNLDEEAQETEEGWDAHHQANPQGQHPYYYDEADDADVDETEPGGRPFDGTDI